MTAGVSAFSTGRGAALSRGAAVSCGATTDVAVWVGASAAGGVLTQPTSAIAVNRRRALCTHSTVVRPRSGVV
jgi:hypothetical protein